MLDQLLANKGQRIVVELVNGRKISGTVLSANQQYLRLETDEGIGNIPVQAVYIVWETPAQTLTQENMDEIAGKLRDSVKAHIACTAFPGFSCSRSYICRPPDTCSFRFACPGSYVPSFPSGGGACPFFACGPFQFGQPCRPFTFGGCGPFTFACRPFTFGGFQCGAVGGFICGGQQFFGIAPGGGSQCGAVGGFVCHGQQFFGAPVKPPGMTAQTPPISPMEFSVKPEGPKDDDKLKKE